ncbi:mCG1049304 [Mus musculus]|jgi:5'-methylthioadenosine phosphorylase|nr:mCG1049304 [Mus musculus]
MSSKVNYQENIWALKEEGCTHVIVTLREEIQPADMVIINQYIDTISLRPQTFYDGSHCSTRGVCRIKTREILIETKKLGVWCRPKGTMSQLRGRHKKTFYF